MIVDEDVLEKDDMYVLDLMKEFISQEDVSKLAAAKQLMILIERSVRHGFFYFDCLSDLPRLEERRRSQGSHNHKSRTSTTIHSSQESQETEIA
jgi:hypothetical protein